VEAFYALIWRPARMTDDAISSIERFISPRRLPSIMTTQASRLQICGNVGMGSCGTIRVFKKILASPEPNTIYK